MIATDILRTFCCTGKSHPRSTIPWWLISISLVTHHPPVHSFLVHLTTPSLLPHVSLLSHCAFGCGRYVLSSPLHVQSIILKSAPVHLFFTSIPSPPCSVEANTFLFSRCDESYSRNSCLHWHCSHPFLFLQFSVISPVHHFIGPCFPPSFLYPFFLS